MESLYARTPLQDSKNQIKLLRWKPFDPQFHEDAVYCMEVLDCDENWLHYTAISYTWGDPFPTLPILVNGHTVLVRVQCWYALWQLRYYGHTQNIWIDSISINQQDHVEKNAQVAMMGDIYEMANSVSACISASDVLSKAIPFTNRGQRANSEIDTKSTEVISRTVEDLGALPYFDSFWIKQEIILAKKVYLLNGMVQLDLDGSNQRRQKWPPKAHVDFQSSRNNQRRQKRLLEAQITLRNFCSIGQLLDPWTTTLRRLSSL